MFIVFPRLSLLFNKTPVPQACVLWFVSPEWFGLGGGGQGLAL